MLFMQIVQIYVDGYGYMSVCTCVCLRLIFDIVTSSFTYWGGSFVESGATLSSSTISLVASTVPNNCILQKDYPQSSFLLAY